MRTKVLILLSVLLLSVGCKSTLSTNPMVQNSSAESRADADIIKAIELSDDFQKHKRVFISASRRLIDEGRCSLEILQYNGGWTRSQMRRGGAIYFTYLRARGATVRDRIYLNANTGELFK